MSEKTCSICRRPYTGYGTTLPLRRQGAEPVNQGRCCDECNFTDVIPARLWQSLLDRGELGRSSLRPDPEPR